MKIYLIRHGETTGDVEDRFGGDYDDGLTEKGKEQAAELAKSLKGKGIEVVLHSPRIRAVETARIVSSATGATLEQVDSFRERNNYGVLTGLTKVEAATQFPDEVAKIEKDRTYHDVRDSESYESFKERAIAAFGEIGKRSESVVAIVTHGGIISGLAREVFGYPQIKIGDCGVVEVDLGREKTGEKPTMRCLINATI